jgi:hypothetical protein
MSVKYWILVLGLGSAMLCRATGTDAAFLQEEGHIQVALRAIGHELLLSIGDSTSRVLPVQQEGNRYKIPFATAFQLDPAQLTKLVKEVTATIAFPQDYIVEVEACNALEIVYAYEIRGHSSSDLIPCQGRALPNDCYNLVFTFPETPAGNTVEEMDHGQVLIDWKYAGWLLLILVLAGAIAYFRYRQPSLQKVAAEQRPLGSYHFSPATMELSRQGQVTPLTAKEAELLALLHDHANETLERDLLLKTVWGNEDSYVGRTLDVFISRLRRKLEDDPTVKIANIRGVGYKLVLAR